MSARIPLTPYDRLFLAGHTALRARGLPGLPIVLMADVAGPLNTAWLREQFRRVVRAHPVLTARIGYSLLTARAHWRPASPIVADAALDQAVSFHYGADDADRLSQFDRLRLQILNEPLDPAAAVQLRLHHMRWSTERHTLILHYGHYVMDLHGGCRFLQQLTERPPHADHAGNSPDRSRQSVAAPPGDPAEWTGGRVRRWWQGMGLRRGWSGRGAMLMKPRPLDADPRGDGVLRQWTSEQSADFEAAAREACRPGPLLYTRHAVIAALRAIDRRRGQFGLSGDDFVVPVPFGRPAADEREFTPFNDITIAAIRVPRALTHDPQKLDAELSRQLEQYTRQRDDEATWRLMSYAGWLRAGHYQFLLGRGMGLPPATISISAYRAPSFSDFTGNAGSEFAQIEWIAAHGLPTIPPGLMFTLVRHRRHWTLAATFFPHVWPRDAVASVVEEFERLALGCRALQATAV